MGLLDRYRRPAEVFPARGSDLGASVAAATTALAGMESTADQARTAAVGATSEVNGPGLAPIPGKIKRDPRSARARFFARRIGFIHQAYRFYSYQGARCPLTFERSLNGGVDWEVVPPEADPWGNGVVQGIRGPGGTSAEIIRPALYHDGTIGEFMLCDVTEDGATPAFIVRDPQACEKKKKGSRQIRRRQQQQGGADQATWLIKEQEGARPADGPGAIIELAADRVYRHWQPDEEWHLMATSSLMGAVDDCDTYWMLLRQLRREANSRLAMAKILWTPSEAHVTKIMVNGQEVSKLQAGIAAAAASSLNDIDDSDVASAAPFLIDTPGKDNMPKPEMIDIPALEAGLLTYLQDARRMVAAAMPLSTSLILEAQEQENHWGDWLADQKDVEAIGEGLRRVLDTLTTVIVRPALDVGIRTGAWVPAPIPAGDPSEDEGQAAEQPGPTDVAMYRVGYDPEAIRRTLDLAEAARWAAENGHIHDEAALGYMHFKDSDRPDDIQWAAMLQRRREWSEAIVKPAVPGQPGALMPGELNGDQRQAIGPAAGAQANPTAPGQLPAGGAVPNGGVPPTPGQMPKAATISVIDDRWLLGAPR